MKRIHIKGGRVIDPANKRDEVADVFIANGRIASIGKQPAGFTADETIDASNKIVCPGLVDMCASLREPGYEFKATIESETIAAAAAGITTLCCPPNTNPVIDTTAVVESIQQRAKVVGKARVVTVGALTKGLKGQQISEMVALKDVGCVAVGNGLNSIPDAQIMRRAMEYAASHDITVFVFAEDKGLRGKGCSHEGPVGTRMGLAGIPEIAETIAVSRDLALVEVTGARVHFLHLSSARAVRMVARAQFDGLPVSANVTAHHLHLLDIDLADFDSNYHVRPPLRTQRDRDGLRQGLASGAITAICSDHQPHDIDAKLGPFGETEPGISGLETLLPLTLKLVNEKILDLPSAIALLTHRPASILKLDAGTLSEGVVADVCVFDPELDWVLNDKTWLSRGTNTPFRGRSLVGRVTHTVFEGKLVYRLAQ